MHVLFNNIHKKAGSGHEPAFFADSRGRNERPGLMIERSTERIERSSGENEPFTVINEHSTNENERFSGTNERSGNYRKENVS